VQNKKQWYQMHPLRWPMFNMWDKEYDFDLPWSRVFWGMALSLPCIVASSVLATITPWLVMPVIMVFFMLAWVAPTLGKLHPLAKVPKYLPDSRSYGCHDRNPLHTLAIEYWDLSDEDKRSFPTNIIDVMSNPDLTTTQRHKVVYAMEETFRAINAKDAQKREVVRRDIDISSVLQYMEDQRSGLEIERKTYEELM